MNTRFGLPPWSALVAISLAALLAAPLGSAHADESDPVPTLITLQTDRTPVQEVLNVLADRSGLNIVTGSGVTGRTISLRLQGTPFDEALNLVCRASGLGYERLGGSILVADPALLSRGTGQSVRVFDIDYADADVVREALEVISNDIRADISANRVVMWGPQSALEEAARAIEALDAKPGQVLLEARLIEVNTTMLEEYGVDWERITKWRGVVTEGNYGPSAPGQIPDAIDFLHIGDGKRFFRQAESFDLAIDALITDGFARVLTNSKVVTVDGMPAEIFAGETVPVVITSLQSPGGGGGVLQTVTLEKIDVGVRLNITPRITDDGYVTTLVEPEVSRIVAFVGPDDDLPQTSTRRARSLVRVKDGEKIFLGGFIIEENRRSVKKVPLLGHIPLLGYLFQHRRTEVVRLDLLIEITPRIIGDDGLVMPEPGAMSAADVERDRLREVEREVGSARRGARQASREAELAEGPAQQAAETAAREAEQAVEEAAREARAQDEDEDSAVLPW